MELKAIVWDALSKALIGKLRDHRRVIVPGLGTFSRFPDKSIVFDAAVELKARGVPVSERRSQTAQSNRSSSGAVVLSLHQLNLGSYGQGELKAAFEANLKAVSELVRSRGEMPFGPLGKLVARNGSLLLHNAQENSTGVTEDGAQWLRTQLGIDLNPSLSSVKSDRPGSMASSRIRFRSTQQLGRSGAMHFVCENHAKLALILQARDDTGSGLLPFEDFFAGLQLLEHPGLTRTFAQELVNLSNARKKDSVRYRQIIDTLTRHRHPGTSLASDVTAFYSREALAPLARAIWAKKLVITGLAQQSGLRPRVPQQPSQLLQTLRKAGVNVNIHQLRALLREALLIQPSVLDLLRAVREILSPAEDLSSLGELESSQRTPTPLPDDSHVEKVRNALSGFDLGALFVRISQGREVVSKQDFVEGITREAGGRVRAFEVMKAFDRVAFGGNALNLEDFQMAFRPREPPTAVRAKGLQQLQDWLRDQRLTSEQGFQALCRAGGASDKLNLEQFRRALADLGFNAYEALALFNELDCNNDSAIDLSEWVNKVYEIGGPYQAIRDVVLENGIQADDLLIKFNIKDQQKIGLESLAGILQQMDPTLTAAKAVDMARAATGGKDYVYVQDFLLQLAQPPVAYEGDWKEQILRKIQAHIKGDLQALRNALERRDGNQQGRLHLSEFQDCLYRFGVGLQPLEIERLSRILDRKGDHFVSYYDFLDNIQGPMVPPPDPFRNSISRLLVFMSQNNLTPAQLLKRLGPNVTPVNFAKFLRMKVNKGLDTQTALEVAARFDINRDGSIDLNDLTFAVNSKSFATLSDSDAFPKQRLDPERAKNAIKQIKTALVQRSINFRDAFNMLDTQKKGLLSAKEFSDGLSKVVGLSRQAKDGLFATMDKQNIGLVDFENFVSVLKDHDIEPKQHGDDWEWENKTLAEISHWITAQRLTIEDAFRAFDKNFDGVLSKDDLRSSLLSILHKEPREIVSSRLDRLYKLLDTYKRNSVQLSDFKLLFQEGLTPDWKSTSKQQIGLFVSKNYPDLQSAFDTISELTGKITWGQFKSWVESNQVLRGFNLTNELLQQLYAYLDPHKKGYLSYKDWSLAFGNFDWNSQCLTELKDSIRSTFANPDSAFQYFMEGAGSSSSLNFEEFSRAVHRLIPSRFSSAEINKIWSEVTRESGKFDHGTFVKHFGNCHYLSSFSQKGSSKSSSRFTGSSLRTLNSNDGDPIKRLRVLIKASPHNIENIFKEIDADRSGSISYMEFRRAMRQLNLGLTAKDIDEVLRRIDANNDGTVQWKEFAAQFKPNEAEGHISSVAKDRVLHFTNLMYKYMVSPMDAFKQFDRNRKNSLNFSEFSELIKALVQTAGEEQPAFPVLKDLFDIVDLRKDGSIDLREWLNTFKQQKNPAEGFLDFSEVCKAIARNRKTLGLTFDAMSKNGLVSYTDAKNVLGSVLRDMRMTNQLWYDLLKVADKSGQVNYKNLLNIYKARAADSTQHPKP